MTTFRLTDEQLEAVLRAYVPAAPADLRERIEVLAGATPQRGPLPSWLAPLADPGRRPIDRRLLLAATLALLLLAGIAGALIGQQLLQPPGPDELLQRTWGAMADPPPFEMDLADEAGRPYQLLSDGEGRVRLSTTDSDDPANNDWEIVLEPGRRGRSDRSMQLWINEERPVEPALAEIWTSDRVDGWREGAGTRAWPPSPTCAWQEPEATTVAGRPAHRLLCPGLTLTIDDETGLPLAGSWVDGEGQRTILTATALRFVTPPAEAFRFESDQAGVMDLTEPPPATESVEPVDAAQLVRDALVALESLPPFTMLVHDSQGSMVRWSHAGDGLMRMDHFGNRADDAPSDHWIASPGRHLRVEMDAEGNRVAVIYDDQPDPRLELRYGLSEGCAEWASVGTAVVAGRPAHHVEGCDTDLWLDVEHRIVLRSDGFITPVTDPTRLDQRVVAEVVELDLAPPPADRFDESALTQGLETITAAEFQCRMDPAACPDPNAASEPPFEPLPTPPAADAPVGTTTDAEDVVALARTRHDGLPAMAMTLREQQFGTGPGGNDLERRVYLDGTGLRRDEMDWDLVDPDNVPTVTIWLPTVMYEQWVEPTGTFWRRYDSASDDWSTAYGFGIEQDCGEPWRHAGFATIGGRLVHHLTCAPRHYWIDAETGTVLRFQRDATFASPDAWITEITSLEEGPQDPALFELPPGADVQ
jgi:hypothetical protein